MALFEWRDEYSVGVADIDRQHKKLVDLINRLHSEMLKGAPQPALSAILKDLAQYTRSHFNAEEALMRLYKYPGYLPHVREHEKLAEQVFSYAADVDGGRIAVSVQLLQFLKDWLRNHILQSDKGYSVHLRSAGAR